MVGSGFSVLGANQVTEKALVNSVPLSAVICTGVPCEFHALHALHALQMLELCQQPVDACLTGAKRVILVSLSTTTIIAVWLRFVW